jgi:ParB-like chromosome segregation protein Spo0J
VVKITKGKPPKADNHTEVHQPVVGEAGPRTANLEALAKSFAPMVTVRAVDDLKANPRNARTHSAQQVEQIAASVREFGWITPIVVDEDGVVLAGHGRLQAARLLGLTGVPTVQVKHLTAERKRAFMLADNRLAELAGWDESLLTIELKELSDLSIDFDFEVTGFGTVDLDRLEAPAPVKPSKQEVVPEMERDRPAVSALGDLWKLGPHLLLCGSALEEASYAKLLGEQRADGIHRPALQRKD